MIMKSRMKIMIMEIVMIMTAVMIVTMAGMKILMGDNEDSNYYDDNNDADTNEDNEDEDAAVHNNDENGVAIATVLAPPTSTQ